MPFTIPTNSSSPSYLLSGSVLDTERLYSSETTMSNADDCDRTDSETSTSHSLSEDSGDAGYKFDGKPYLVNQVNSSKDRDDSLK